MSTNTHKYLSNLTLSQTKVRLRPWGLTRKYSVQVEWVPNNVHSIAIFSTKECKYTTFHCAESCLRNWQLLSYSKNLPYLIEPEGSLPHSQQPITCSYPEPDRSSPCPIPFLSHSFSYYSPIYILVFHVVSFPQVSLPYNTIKRNWKITVFRLHFCMSNRPWFNPLHVQGVVLFSETHPAFQSMSAENVLHSDRGGRLITQLCLVSRLRMCGAIPPLLHVTSFEFTGNKSTFFNM